MGEAKNEFTRVTSLRAEAQGEPGQRTFRILVQSGSSMATIWLEKEQLLQLSLASQQLVVTLPEQGKTASTAPFGREAPELTRLDFKAGRLVLGYDGRRGLFLIDAHNLEEDDGSPAVRAWASKEQVKEFADEAMRVCAAGRSVCPLCGAPIDPTGHWCSRANGHMKPTDMTDL